MRGPLLAALAASLLIVGPTDRAATPEPGPSASSADQDGALTALDYVQIEQLVHRLQYALDFCTRGGQDFADIFAPGGRFIIDQGPADVRILSTREQLVKLAGGPDCKAVRVAPRSYILHMEANLIITPTPQGARGISYAIYPANRGNYYKPEFAGRVGIYLDEYVRTGKDWRLLTRHHLVNVDPASAPALSK